ncbi:hypothetical protein Bpfe_023629 [Biomphalaria pfeifferi]|uniref:Uncharacterized protein n=1 Tax=Biomphalaria pfeifferi TaxID=112525 RepID=A0AAD8B2R2_BIOPF|nr:hypothetical protein Bpfe_023629 [Biomphalaria pfeifferi]
MATPRPRTSYDLYRDVIYTPMVDDRPPLSTDIPSPERQLRPLTSRHSFTRESRQSRPKTRAATPALGEQPLDSDIQYISSREKEDKEDKNPFTQPMDPINRQYYYKLWRRSPPRLQQPVFREGRVGAGWRHVKACNVSTGNYLCFIDGTVKAEENYFYPPEVMYEPLKLPKFVPPVTFKDTLVQVPVTYRGNTSESHLGQRTLPGCETWRRPKQYVDSYDVWWTRH